MFYLTVLFVDYAIFALNNSYVMTTFVALEDMYFKAFHGYYEAERKMGNEFFIDVVLEVSTPSDYADDIDKTINYETVYSICKEEMNDTRLLLETVVQSIVDRIQTTWKNVISGSVKMKKLGPQLGGKVKYAIVEIKF